MKGAQVGDRNLLSPDFGVEAESGQGGRDAFMGISGGGQVVGQRFPALGETGVNEAPENSLVVEKDERRFAPLEQDDGRIDFRRRNERARSDFEQDADREKNLEQDPQRGE